MEIRENTLKYKIQKRIPPLLIAALVIFLIWQAFGSMLPGLLPLLREGDEQKIAEYLAEQQGTKGIISVMLLSGIQVVSVVLPGLAIQIAAGLIYGWLKAFLLCYSGFVIANALVFTFARHMGGTRSDKVTIGGSGRRFLEKLRSYPPPFMICILNMVPAIPNGVIPYLASQMNITLLQYVQAVMAGSFLQILVGCLAGSFIMKGDWLYMIITFVLQVIVIILFWWQKNRIIAWMEKRHGLIEKIRQERRQRKAVAASAVQAAGDGTVAGAGSGVPESVRGTEETVGERLDRLKGKFGAIREGIMKNDGKGEN